MASRNGVQTWTKPTKQFHPCPQSTCRQNGEGPCLPTQLPARPYTFSLCCGGSQDVRVLPGSPQEGGRLHKVQEEKGKDFQMGVVTLLQLWVEEDKGTGGQGHPCLQWLQSFLSCCNLRWHLQDGKLISLSLSVDHLWIANLNWCCPRLLPLLSCMEKVWFCMHWNITVMKTFKKSVAIKIILNLISTLLVKTAFLLFCTSVLDRYQVDKIYLLVVSLSPF